MYRRECSGGGVPGASGLRHSCSLLCPSACRRTWDTVGAPQVVWGEGVFIQTHTTHTSLFLVCFQLSQFIFAFVCPFLELCHQQTLS